MVQKPRIDVIAGPNGSGKSTVALELLSHSGGPSVFVNADAIARGLSGLAYAETELEAGRLMLDRIRRLIRQRRSVAFETTLAARSYASLLRDSAASGYRICIHYVWVHPVELALSRIAARVRNGGHDVPESIVRRRYVRSAANFFGLYQSLADGWEVLDNSGSGLSPVAFGIGARRTRVVDEKAYECMRLAANA